MPYNSKNKNKQIFIIQQITLNYKAKRWQQLKVYEKIIQPRYSISYSTFNRYLGVRIKRSEIENIEEAEKEIKRITEGVVDGTVITEMAKILGVKENDLYQALKRIVKNEKENY